MTEHGLGALHRLIPDPRDYRIDALYAIEGIEPTAPDALPAAYSVANMPAVLDQGGTPQCVAFASAGIKGWQDKRDQSRWFDFDEPKFFAQIGGTEYGAYVEDAMARMLTYGYPVAGTGQASLHKIAAYYVVPTSYDALRAAILDLGPIVVSTEWYASWWGTTTAGVLRAPTSPVGGHAIVAFGWDSRGLRLRNSWGSDWGINGDCWLPPAYLDSLRGAWKVKDQVVHPIPWVHTVVTATALRMRREPSTTSPILATLPAGHKQPTRRLEKYGGVYPAGGLRRTDWYEIDHANKRGWIARAYTRQVS